MLPFIKRFKKWLIGLVILTASAAALPAILPEAKPQIDDVVSSEAATDHIKYIYLTKPFSKGLPNGAVGEDVDKRTYNSRTFTTSDPNKFIFTFSTGQIYYKDDFGDWWETEYATTTPSDFQNKRAVPKKVSLFDTVHADTFTPSFDGFFGRTFGAGETFTSVRTGAGTFGGTNDGDASSVTRTYSHTDTDKYIQQYISAWYFDTSAITDGFTCTSATLALRVDGHSDAMPGSLYLTPARLASETATAAADYTAHLGHMNVDLSDTHPTFTAMVDGTDITFTFNAAGLAAISPTSTTRLGTVTNFDFTNTAPTWASDNYGGASMNAVEGTTDPLLTATCSLAAVGGADSGEGIMFQLIQNFIPKVFAWKQ